MAFAQLRISQNISPVDKRRIFIYKHIYYTRVFSFGCFPGVWLILTDVSEHSIFSIFKAVDLEVNTESLKSRTFIIVINFSSKIYI
jgi:hypothetical protein